jgi:hypothetical protein
VGVGDGVGVGEGVCGGDGVGVGVAMGVVQSRPKNAVILAMSPTST